MPTFIAAPLLASWGVPALGAMMAIVVLVSLVCTALLPETKGAPMRQDDEPHWGAGGKSVTAGLAEPPASSIP